MSIGIGIGKEKKEQKREHGEIMESIKKPLIAFDDNIGEVIRLISFHRNNPIIMGSARYLYYNYPSDIDLWSLIHESKNREEFRSEAVRIFQSMIKELSELNNIYILDFKIELKNGNKLRWSPEEILDGKLGKIKLADVVLDNGMIKIDIIFYHNSLFTEFSNIFTIMDKNYVPKTSAEIVDMIKGDIRDLIKNGNYFKSLKRIYSIAQIEHSEPLIKKIFPFINGPCGKLGQIRSYLESITLLFTKYRDEDLIQKVYSSVALLKSMCVFKKEDLTLPPKIFEKFEAIIASKGIPAITLRTNKLIDEINKVLQKEAKAFYLKLGRK